MRTEIRLSEENLPIDIKDGVSVTVTTVPPHTM